MIYLDTSVVLAHLLSEDRRPPASLWAESLASSRLLIYEVYNRLHARGLGDSHGESARQILARIGFLELAEPIISRALDPFPTSVRTLDALHLASAEFLVRRQQSVKIASYDVRLLEAAHALGFDQAVRHRGERSVAPPAFSVTG